MVTTLQWTRDELSPELETELAAYRYTRLWESWHRICPAGLDMNGTGSKDQAMSTQSSRTRMEEFRAAHGFCQPLSRTYSPKILHAPA